MASVLILYSTGEGHTAKLAAAIAACLRDAGHRVLVRHARTAQAPPDLGGYDGVIVGASVHYGRHPRFMQALVGRQQHRLQDLYTAFFSVSLSASRTGAGARAARRYAASFLRGCGWQPGEIGIFAGALRYSRYGMLKRRMMQAFVLWAGGDTDSSRDYEYTDWAAVARFAAAFARGLPATA